MNLGTVPSAKAQKKPPKSLFILKISITFAVSFCITLNFIHMEKTMIPEDNSVESIKVREQIIREFYHEWKEK